MRGALAGSVERGFPSGPWVLVLGMHRSGTSALTGALGRLGVGLPAPGDLVTGRYDNPVHYESGALTDLDDAVLGALGGSWSAPPAMPAGWERSSPVLAVTTGAAAAARRAFPGDGPVAWKDPRLCLLLPLWRGLLPAPVVTVLLWREPTAVARSLRARQGFPLSLGLALWERYTREALCALAGHEAYVLRYEDLVGDPVATVAGVAHWLADGRAPVVADDAALAAAAGTVSEGRGATDGAAEVPPVLMEAMATLTRLRGAQATMPACEAAAPPAWMDDAIAQRADYEDLYARYMRYVRWRRRIPVLGRAVRRGR